MTRAPKHALHHHSIRFATTFRVYTLRWLANIRLSNVECTRTSAACIQQRRGGNRVNISAARDLWLYLDRYLSSQRWSFFGAPQFQPFQPFIYILIICALYASSNLWINKGKKSIGKNRRWLLACAFSGCANAMRLSVLHFITHERVHMIRTCNQTAANWMWTHNKCSNKMHLYSNFFFALFLSRSLFCSFHRTQLKANECSFVCLRILISLNVFADIFCAPRK